MVGSGFLNLGRVFRCCLCLSLDDLGCSARVTHGVRPVGDCVVDLLSVLDHIVLRVVGEGLSLRSVVAALLMVSVVVDLSAFVEKVALLRLWACGTAWMMSCPEMCRVSGSCSSVRACVVFDHTWGFVARSVSAASLI